MAVPLSGVGCALFRSCSVLFAASAAFTQILIVVGAAVGSLTPSCPSTPCETFFHFHELSDGELFTHVRHAPQQAARGGQHRAVLLFHPPRAARRGVHVAIQYIGDQPGRGYERAGLGGASRRS